MYSLIKRPLVGQLEVSSANPRDDEGHGYNQSGSATIGRFWSDEEKDDAASKAHTLLRETDRKSVV